MPAKNSLFQQGGWATQLSCDNPALVSWLKYIEGARQTTCSVLGVDCTTHENQCEQWTPLAIILTAVAVLLVAVYLLAVLLTSFVEYVCIWQKQSRNSITDTVRAATEAAALMRKQSPERFPPTPHSWYQLKAEDDELGAPILCCSCYTRVDPEGSRVQCCEVCGVVAHDGTCVRKAAHDCRPVTEASESMVHLWQPAGTIYYDSEDVFQDEEAVQVCIYCHHPCDADVFHPAWTCAWCRVHAHVSCYHTYHADESAPTQHGENHSSSQGQGSGAKRPPVVSNNIRRSLDGIPEGSEGKEGLLSRASASLDALLSLVKAPPPSGPADKALFGPHVRRPSHVDIARLDACSCGPHGRLVLPPVAVELMPNEDSWTELAKQFLRRESFLGQRGKHGRRKKKGATHDGAEMDRRRSAEPGRAESWDADDLQGASPMSSQEITWEESSRDGSQRPGSDGKREALLARWLQEGNKRLRERLNAGLSRQSDPGPPPSVSSGPASVKGKELDSKQTNGAQEATGATSETVAAHKTDAVDASQQQAEPEHASSQAAVMPPNGNALFAQHNPFEDAAKAEQSLSTAEEAEEKPGQYTLPLPPSEGADKSTSNHEAQQRCEEESNPKAVPRLKIPLSPSSASARELPSGRGAQPDSSARSLGHISEQPPDEGWSPRQATARSPRTDARGFMAAVSGYVSSSEGAGGTKMRRPGWWRGPAVTSWAQYRIDREKLPSGCSPLLVFLNTKSGAQVGALMRRRFLRLLNPLQVVELPKEEPEAALRLFADIPGLRVLVVGGDGTIGWILSVLDKLQQQFAAQQDPWHWALPPVAVLPLGTGNDLARCLNWGGGLYVLRDRGLPTMLHDVEHATVSLLDRWDVQITKQQPELSSAAQQIQRMSSLVARDKPEAEQAQTKVMNNYMGIGVDAKVSLEFDRLRTKFPQWFKSQMGNKVWYTTMGAKDIIGHAISASAGSLQSKIKVEVDGKTLALPADIEGVLLLNIPSYAGGVNLWASGAAAGSAADEEAVQSVCDGMLEVCGVHGSWHLGQLQIGLSRPIKLAQCRSAKITLLESIPVQMDGEPWRQPPATLEVSLHSQAFMLRRIESGPVAKVARAVAEVLASCEAKGVISSMQRHSLTAEIAGKLQNVL